MTPEQPNKEWYDDELGTIVRDICAVGYGIKSEVRKRFEVLLAESHRRGELKAWEEVKKIIKEETDFALEEESQTKLTNESDKDAYWDSGWATGYKNAALSILSKINSRLASIEDSRHA